MKRLNELHEQVKQIVDSQDLSIPECGKGVIELHKEWTREFMRLTERK